MQAGIPQKKWSGHHGEQKSLKCSTWMQSQKRQNDLCSFPRQTMDAQDRRALRITLTDAGNKVWRNKASVCSERVMAAAQRSLDSTEQVQLYDYLTRVLHALRDKS